MLADNLEPNQRLVGGAVAAEVTRDRGAVIRDVAVAIAGGAENLAGTAVLRNQARLFGPVAPHRHCGGRSRSTTRVWPGSRWCVTRFAGGCGS